MHASWPKAQFLRVGKQVSISYRRLLRVLLYPSPCEAFIQVGASARELRVSKPRPTNY
jgi:hypothetical protein